MAYKVIKWLVIPIFVILLMSHNVNALDFVIPLDNYDIVQTFNTPNVTCYFADNTSQVVEGTPCTFSGSNTIYNFKVTTNWSARLGDLFTMDVITVGNSTLTTGSTVSGSLGSNIKQYIRTGSSQPVSVLSVETLTFDSQQSLINYYLELASRSVGTGQTTTGYPEISIDYRYITVYRVYFRVDTDSNNLTFTTSGYESIPSFSFYDLYNSPTGSVWFNRFVAYRPFQSKEDEAAEKEIESTENIENQSTSDTPGGDNQSATNLIGNISGIFNQIANIPVGSSCTIDADFGNLDLGNLNLCTGKDKMPFIVNFGATVFQLVFVLSTGLILVRQVLSLYDWSRK